MSSTFLRSSSSSSSSSTSTPNEQYQQFVAQQIAIQNHDLEDDSYDTFEGSYVGSYYWSALEKKRFFLALDRYGPHEPSLIQQRIGSTKSVFQVSLYLDLLATASEQHPMEQEDHTYIPFAYEMSDHWMSLEEDLAEQCMSLSDDHMIELNTRWIKERQTTRRKRRTHTSKEVFAAWDIFDRIAMDNLVSRRFKTDENGKKDNGEDQDDMEEVKAEDNTDDDDDDDDDKTEDKDGDDDMEEVKAEDKDDDDDDDDDDKTEDKDDDDDKADVEDECNTGDENDDDDGDEDECDKHVDINPCISTLICEETSVLLYRILRQYIKDIIAMVIWTQRYLITGDDNEQNDSDDEENDSSNDNTDDEVIEDDITDDEAIKDENTDGEATIEDTKVISFSSSSKRKSTSTSKQPRKKKKVTKVCRIHKMHISKILSTYFGHKNGKFDRDTLDLITEGMVEANINNDSDNDDSSDEETDDEDDSNDEEDATLDEADEAFMREMDAQHEQELYHLIHS